MRVFGPSDRVCAHASTLPPTGPPSCSVPPPMVSPRPTGPNALMVSPAATTAALPLRTSEANAVPGTASTSKALPRTSPWNEDPKFMRVYSFEFELELELELEKTVDAARAVVRARAAPATADSGREWDF